MNGVFILLVISVWINYIDRGTLSVAAPVIAPELGLNPTEMGVLLGAFFWTYAGFQVPGGWLVDRFPVKYVYAAGFAIWTIATFVTGLGSTFTIIFLFRLLLGLGESVAYPCYSKFLAAQIPEDRRGFANSLLDVGTKAGPGLGTLIGGLTIQAFGWRVFFVALGAMSFLWIIPWMKYAPVKIGAHRHEALAGPSFMTILKQRAGWATCFGLFFVNYVYYFLLTWIPSYLRNERKFSLTLMAIYGALPYVGTAACSMFGGWWADRQIRRGNPAGPTRRKIIVTGAAICLVALPLATVPNTFASMIALFVAFAAFGLCSSNVWAFSQTLAGPLAAGRWTGLQNGMGNLAGVIAPITTGWIVANTGSFQFAFFASSLSLVFAALVYTVVLGPAHPVRWPESERALSTAQ